MLERREFWLTINAFTLAIHLAGAGLLLTGSSLGHPLVLVWLVLVALHVLEIPVSLKAVGPRPINVLVILGNTLLFGFTWWLPVRMGVYGPSPIQR